MSFETHEVVYHGTLVATLFGMNQLDSTIPRSNMKMVIPGTILLACDLDRTVVPNGLEPPSAGAQEAFASFVTQPNVFLVYVTGRHLALVEDVLSEYQLPQPDVVVGDVGTTIYLNTNGLFSILLDWHAHIAPDWNGETAQSIQTLMSDFDTLTLQEPVKQGTYKVSFYAPEQTAKDELIGEIGARLARVGIHASVVFSIDTVGHFAYVDVVPASATKKGALQYLVDLLQVDSERVVYAGDSGNDLEPLTSGCKAIVVNNADTHFKEEVMSIATEKGIPHRVYIAQGEQGMNGNYTAGILEGLRYFGFLHA